jgi:hypothetical protein
MKTLLLLSLYLSFVAVGQSPATFAPDSSVAVLGFQCTKARQKLNAADSTSTTPARQEITPNKNYNQKVRVCDPTGTKNPNEDSMDGRSAAMEKNVQDSRNPNRKPVDGFAYQVRVQNTSKKAIEVLFWEYQFVDPPDAAANVTRRQFLCGVNVKAGKNTELQAFSASGPSHAVSTGSLGNGSGNRVKENVVINRVEYADGSIWQRKDWNFGEIKTAYERAIATPWQLGECRGL